MKRTLTLIALATLIFTPDANYVYYSYDPTSGAGPGQRWGQLPRPILFQGRRSMRGQGLLLSTIVSVIQVASDWTLTVAVPNEAAAS